MAVITLSYELQTNSEKLAAQLAEKLGYEYIGDALVARIAEELNISKSEVETFRKTSQSRILRFVDRYTCSIVQKVVDHEYGCLDDKKYYEATRKLVEQSYEAGNVIILGWGGQCILRGKPDTLHIRLIKDDNLKIEEVMESRHLNYQAAKKFLEREEGDLQAYITEYFNEDWNDSQLYDLIINMGKTSVEKAVELIIDVLKHKTG